MKLEGEAPAATTSLVFGLGVLGGHEPGGSGIAPDISIFASTSQDHHKDFLQASNALNAFERGNLLPYVARNYQRYYETRAQYQRHAASGQLWQLSSLMLDMSTELLNWLSSMRLFLDLTAHQLTTEFGASSSSAEHLNAVTSLEYDNEFAYRFMYRLRNYGQHRALPIHNARIRSWIENIDTPSEKHKHEFKLLFQRDKLLQERDVWGRALREELAGMAPEFEVEPLLEVAMGSVVKIAEEARHLLFPRIEEATETLTQLEARFADHAGLPVLTSYEFVDADTMPRRISFAPLDFVQLNRVRRLIGQPLS